MNEEEIDSSHNMRPFSDIPWECWSCGACTCHHQEILKNPCVKAKKKEEHHGKAQ